MACRAVLFLSLAMIVPAAAQNIPPLTGMPCLQKGNVSEFVLVHGARMLIVIDRQRRRYRLNFASACSLLQINPSLGFNTLNPSPYSCLSRGDSIYSSTDEAAQRICRIQSIAYHNAPPPDGTPASPPVAPGRGRG
jgi:hypothetical protein